MSMLSIAPPASTVNPHILSARRVYDQLEITLGEESTETTRTVFVSVPSGKSDSPVEEILRLLCGLTGTLLDTLRTSWGVTRWDGEEITTGNKPLDRLVARLQLSLGSPLPDDVATAESCWRAIMMGISPKPARYPQVCATCAAAVVKDQLIRVAQGTGVIACASCDETLRTDESGLVYGLPVQEIGALQVPHGYLLASDGIWRSDKVEEVTLAEPLLVDPAAPLPGPLRAQMRQVVSRPLIITALAKPLDATEVMARINCRIDDGTLWSGWVPRSMVADARAIRDLSRRGYPVTSNNAPALVRYVEALLDDWGPRLPSHLVGTRYGAYVVDGRLTFVLGDGCIGAHGIEIADPHDAFRAALTPEGEATEWVERVGPLAAKYTLLRVALAASFAAALVKVLRVRTFLVHWWGPSRTGKTTISKVSLTVWGDPQQLSSTLNSTQTAATAMYSSINDLPYLLDELQVSTVEVDKLVYALASGQSRGRADIRGRMQPEYTWSAVIQLTGEQPVLGTGRAHDLGGQGNRVLELPVRAEDALTPEATRAIYEFLDERCHGHAGRNFVRGLVALDEAGQIDKVRERFREIRVKLVEETGIDREHTNMAATLATAWHLARVLVFGWTREDALREAIDDAVGVLRRLETERDSRPLHEQVLEFLQDDRLQNPSAYYEVTSHSEFANGKQYSGYQVANEVWIIPSAFTELMNRHGIAPRRAVSELDRANYLVLNEAKSKTCYRECRQVGIQRRRFYVFRAGDI